MRNVLMGLQTVALVLVAVAMVPLVGNQLADRQRRADDQAQARRQVTLGAAALKAGDPELASQAFADALAFEPHDAEALAGIVEAHVAHILADAAGLTVNNVLTLHNEISAAIIKDATLDPRKLLAFGRILQFRGKLKEATAQYQRAAKLAPDDPLGHLLHGDALLKAGDFDSAGVALETSLRLKPDQPTGKFALGQVRMKQKRWEDAAHLLDAASETLKRPGVYLALARTYKELDRWDRVQRAVEQGMKVGLDKGEAYRLLGDAYVQAKQLDRALAAFLKGWERGRDLESLRMVGRSYQALGMAREAGEAYGKFRLLAPEDPEAHCGIGASADALGNLKLAIAAYKRCADIAGKSAKYEDISRQATLRVAALERKAEAAKGGKDGESAKKGRRAGKRGR